MTNLWHLHFQARVCGTGLRCLASVKKAFSRFERIKVVFTACSLSEIVEMCIVNMSKLSWKTVFSYKVSLYKWVKIGSSKSFFTLATRWRAHQFVSGHREMSKILILLLSSSLLLIDNRGNLYRSGKSFVVCCWLWKAFKISQPDREKSQTATMTNANGRCEKSQKPKITQKVDKKSNFKALEFLCRVKSQQQKRVAMMRDSKCLSRPKKFIFYHEKTLRLRISQMRETDELREYVVQMSFSSCCALQEALEFVWDFVSLRN